MLRITADIFSGLENPTWVVEDEREGREILRRVMAEARGVAMAEALWWRQDLDSGGWSSSR